MRSWKYFKPIILLTVIYGIGNLNFFGLSYSFDMEGLGFGYNSIIAGLVELLSFAYLSNLSLLIKTMQLVSYPEEREFQHFIRLSCLLG